MFGTKSLFAQYRNSQTFVHAMQKFKSYHNKYDKRNDSCEVLSDACFIMNAKTDLGLV